MAPMILLVFIRTKSAYCKGIEGIYGRYKKKFIHGGAKDSTRGPKKCLGDTSIFLEGVILRQNLI